jgi:bifunctional DNA-binding transcriptional regulator/antitoxin component of YhaV-PrlF toxin-antitoxin module
MSSIYIKIDNAGRFRIPMEFRKAYGWEPGTRIELTNHEDGLLLNKGAIVSERMKEKAIKYLKFQFEDATNEEDREAILIALKVITKE